jgi:hypothetical protein
VPNLWDIGEQQGTLMWSKTLRGVPEVAVDSGGRPGAAFKGTPREENVFTRPRF